METQEILEENEEQPLATEVKWDGSICLITVEGEVDLATVDTLKMALEEAAGATGTSVIVDLTSVSYMDSSGFAALLEAARHMKAQSGALHLAGCNPNIARMMEITRLNTVFALHPTQKDALRQIGINAAAAAAP